MSVLRVPSLCIPSTPRSIGLKSASRFQSCDISRDIIIQRDGFALYPTLDPRQTSRLPFEGHRFDDRWPFTVCRVGKHNGGGERQDFTWLDNNVAAVSILQPSSLCVCKLLKRSCKARKSPKGEEEAKVGSRTTKFRMQ